MKVIADFSLIPIGVGTSLSPYIARCQEVLSDCDLICRLHAYGTNIEGDWDDVMAAIKKCHDAIHDMGAPRISSILKFGTRIDRVQTCEDKIRSVHNNLSGEPK